MTTATARADLSVIKAARLHERVTLQFRGEFLNALNHAMFSGPNTSPTSSSFGMVTSQRGFPWVPWASAILGR